MQNKLGTIIIWIALAVLFLFWSFSGTYLDWLWYHSLDAAAVFWVTLITGPLAKLLIGALIFGFLALNLYFAIKAFARPHRLVGRDEPDELNQLLINLSKKTVFWPALGGAAFLAFVLASGLSLDWTTIQQFFHRVDTGLTDPIFKRDIGYYLFTFPFLQQLKNLFSTTAFLGLIGTAFIYFLARAFWREGRSWELWKPAKIHLTILTIFFLLSKIWGYYLGRFELLFRESKLLTGINYTAAHANLLALNIMIGIVLAIIILLVIGLFRRGASLLAGGLLLWLGSAFLLGSVYPGFVQTFIVNPSEYEQEKPFIANHIALTRQAFGLDKVKLQTFVPDDTGARQITAEHPALADLRLWDWRPLLNSYNQLQSIRLYYHFNDIDIDRYPSLTGQRQVMIAAREMVPSNLPQKSRNWINFHLSYTHGYGVAANQVSRFSEQGQPIFIARDLPPKTSPDFPALRTERPEVYFGELTEDYVIVNTKNPEFDYPKGDSNVETAYKGKSGIPLDSFFTRLAFAITLGDQNFILSPLLTRKSNVLMHRQIKERAAKLAPFLSFDADPYPVIAGGKLYWMMDAYTASAYYPYSKYVTHQNNAVNYLRNPVKVVIDAYSGSVNFYIIDSEDPIIRVWQRIFPKLFKPLAALNPELAKHFRYPEELLDIQSNVMLQYHMTSPKAFYENEDYWDIPVHNQNEPFEPYYVTLRLPGMEKPEFLMMQPFSPRGKGNLISWLAARCDQPNYGALTLYAMPKDKNVYGPSQIDARINQDQTISQLVTLWNQQQSKVTWGDLLMIPIDNSILYIKPLFLESESGQQAELKKIVIVYQNQVLLGDTVADALVKYRPGAYVPDETATAKPGVTPPAKVDRKAEILKRLEELNQTDRQNIEERQRLINELKRL